MMLRTGVGMDLAAVREIVGSIALKSAFQAFILTASEGGFTVREIAAQIGVPPTTLFRWLTRARNNRARNPYAELVYRPAGAQGEPCIHAQAFYQGRHRICLECLASNFERDLKQMRRFGDPKPDAPNKPAKFRPKGKRTKEVA